MTEDELADLVARTKISGQNEVVLKVMRRVKGDRVRVLPGVMGRVVQWGDGTPNFPTVCFVKVEDLERALAKAPLA